MSTAEIVNHISSNLDLIRKYEGIEFDLRVKDGFAVVGKKDGELYNNINDEDNYKLQSLGFIKSKSRKQ